MKYIDIIHIKSYTEKKIHKIIITVAVTKIFKEDFGNKHREYFIFNSVLELHIYIEQKSIVNNRQKKITKKEDQRPGISKFWFEQKGRTNIILAFKMEFIIYDFTTRRRKKIYRV